MSKYHILGKYIDIKKVKEEDSIKICNIMNEVGIIRKPLLCELHTSKEELCNIKKN